jgi:hypothetical protein
MAEREIRWPAAARRDYAYVVQELRDRGRIRELLLPRVEYTAYALGQLGPGCLSARAGSRRAAIPGRDWCSTRAAGWVTPRS